MSISFVMGVFFQFFLNGLRIFAVIAVFRNDFCFTCVDMFGTGAFRFFARFTLYEDEVQ
jgi:hypothetical protein